MSFQWSNNTVEKRCHSLFSVERKNKYIYTVPYSALLKKKLLFFLHPNTISKPIKNAIILRQKSAWNNISNSLAGPIVLLTWFSLLPVTELTAHKAHCTVQTSSESHVFCRPNQILWTPCPWLLPSSVTVRYAQIIVWQLGYFLMLF